HWTSGQSRTSPRTTVGTASRSSVCSGGTPGLEPSRTRTLATSRDMASGGSLRRGGLLAQALLLLGNQPAHVVQRSADQVGAFQPAGLLQAVQRLRVQRLQALAVDAVQPAQVDG